MEYCYPCPQTLLSPISPTAQRSPPEAVRSMEGLDLSVEHEPVDQLRRNGCSPAQRNDTSRCSIDDCLDVMAVWIDNECGIVVWPVVWSQARCAIVFAAVREGSLVESHDRFPRWCG